MRRRSKPTELSCPWCGRKPVPIKNDRVAPHVTPGNLKCVGAGQPAAHVTMIDNTRKNP